MKSYSSTSDREATPVDVYQIVTDRICAMLEAGTVPWVKPWKASAMVGGASGPRNYVSKKPYRGINAFLLAISPFEAPFWLTFNQARNLGGCVRKGSKGTPVVFWKRLKVEDRAQPGVDKIIPLLRYYTVFNVEQVDGIDWQSKVAKPAPMPDAPAFNPIEAAQRIADNMPNRPSLAHSGERACYSPQLDTVNMPQPESFTCPSAYYSTLFHELTHSTGHKSRLDRKELAEMIRFGDESYSKEELTAEMGAAFLAAQAGIVEETLTPSASYIAHWLGKLRNDRKLVVQASGLAQRAADYILGTTFESDENND